MLIVLLIGAALLLAYANGSNDNFKATATIYGSGALGYRSSLILATVAQVAGSLASVLLAGALLGSPVSTTHVSTGAIVGIGVRTGAADWKVVRGIVLAWVATLPLAALLAAGAATVLRAL